MYFKWQKYNRTLDNLRTCVTPLEKQLKPHIELIKSLLLSDFPSGSSINYHDGKFYLIGDDSTNILLLDTDYQKIDSVQLFDYPEKRIPKSDKIDLEGSVIIEIMGKDHLLILGSASRKNRKMVILIPFSHFGSDFKTLEHSLFKTKDFINRIKSNGIEEINLEGVCLFQKDLLLGNRGNRTSQNNHLIITDRDFYARQDDAKLLVRKLLLPDDQQKFLSISELCFIDLQNILFITLTSEATDNAYDDGEIGNSYIGWIYDATTKLHTHEVTLDGMINLGDVDEIFKNQKVEGICSEYVKPNELILHLVSDNDVGESRLFKVKMRLSK